MVSKSVTELVVSDTQRQLDLEMVPYDIQATSAHVEMLQFVGIIAQEPAQKILTALQDILKCWEQGSFAIDAGLGAQLTLEREVIARVGEEVGLSMHTARSRNDQVMVTEMLYLRERTKELIPAIRAVIDACYARATESVGVIMPGYTHMQPGKPTALSHWYLAHGDCLARAAQAIRSVLEQYDQCPLGAVESFGTSWPIDRLYVAQRLGFSKVWEVPQDAISNRGMFQLALLGAFNQLALGIGRIASDLMLYTTFEYRIAILGDEVAERLHPITGSSVMAQKRNPDALELLRASASQFSGLYATVSNVLCGLPTGYNRDSRETKEYMASAFRKLDSMLRSLLAVMRSTHFDTERMTRMVEENYSLTTDLADRLSQQSGIPYRRMYKIVGSVVDQLMKEGKPLSLLSVEALMQAAKEQGITLKVTSEQLERLRAPQTALSDRAHIGGTNSEVTRLMLRRR